MASKIEWKDALLDLATYMNVARMEPSNGRLSGIKDRHPHDLIIDIAEKIERLSEYKAQVETAREQQAKAAEEMVKAQNEARDKQFEIEDLEYENRALKALIWTLGFDLPVRMTVTPGAFREALEATKDYEAEVYHAPAKDEVSVTFLHKDEYRSPMEGIGWHNFESKED